VLAVVMRVMPKVGPLKAVDFKTPTPQAEKLFMDSFNQTLDRYRALLAAERTRRTQPADMNLDLGEPPVAGKYRMSDDAYAKLVEKHSKHQFASMPPDLRENIMAFYKDENAPISTKKKKRDWVKLQRELDALRNGVAKATQ
jgi:hypothetical protein